MSVDSAGKILQNGKEKLDLRFRALFMLKNFGGQESINYISKCFTDESALLKHELAYCLGQMQDKAAIPILKDVLQDETQEPMVRHEAGEALGAIGCSSAISILEKYKNCDTPEVAETCSLAIQRIKWYNKKSKGEELNSPYSSVDPTPAGSSECTDIEKLKSILIDMNLPMFERYRAMFSLRNIRTDESALALTEGLKCNDSALFRHEVAYVLGQMQLPVTINQLRCNLEDKSENCMVRHECAEALGSIADEKCVAILEKFRSDNDIVVKESCEVALDMHAYENSSEFNYSVSSKKQSC